MFLTLNCLDEYLVPDFIYCNELAAFWSDPQYFLLKTLSWIYQIFIGIIILYLFILYPK